MSRAFNPVSSLEWVHYPDKVPLLVGDIITVEVRPRENKMYHVVSITGDIYCIMEWDSTTGETVTLRAPTFGGQYLLPFANTEGRRLRMTALVGAAAHVHTVTSKLACP